MSILTVLSALSKEPSKQATDNGIGYFKTKKRDNENDKKEHCFHTNKHNEIRKNATHENNYEIRAGKKAIGYA